MSGFRVFKAQVPIEWSQSLYIALSERYAWNQEASQAYNLRLWDFADTTALFCIPTLHPLEEWFNRFSFVIRHIPLSSMVLTWLFFLGNTLWRMVVVETEEMYKARKRSGGQPQSSPAATCCQSFKPCNRFIQHVLIISEDGKALQPDNHVTLFKNDLHL